MGLESTEVRSHCCGGSGNDVTAVIFDVKFLQTFPSAIKAFILELEVFWFSFLIVQAVDFVNFIILFSSSDFLLYPRSWSSYLSAEFGF